jgi:uncharacterized RDD family membrane protein YckC
MPRTFGSWLSGPPPSEAGDHAESAGEYPGQRLGLPPTGPRSLARFGRRIGALLIDWLIAYGLAALGMTLGIVSMATLSTAVLIVWIVLGAISVRLFGFTPGQLAFGLVVVAVDGQEHVGIGRAVARGLLIALVIPALVTDSDLRGLQDRTTNTAVVRR